MAAINMKNPYVSAGVSLAAATLLSYKTWGLAASAAFSPTVFIAWLAAGVALRIFIQTQVNKQLLGARLEQYSIFGGSSFIMSLIVKASNFSTGLHFGMALANAFYCGRDVYPIVARDLKKA